jgi:CheY-like chemotaxis protein
MERELRQSQRLEAVGSLAGGIAHDFNNILTAILGSAELIAGDLENSSPSSVESALSEAAEIRKAALRAGALTYQLLAFSRRQVLQPEIVNLNSVVATTQTMLRRLIGEHITLNTRLADDLDPVKVDPSNMEQVIVNLAVNARDAMPRGGQLTIRTANVELDESFAREHPPTVPGRYVMLSVEDTGEGMDEATGRRVFEPFFTTKEHSTGTGLGLSTVYGIVKQSLGYIWFDTEQGRGTTFSVYFRPVGDPLEEPKPEPEQQVVPVGSETILVAEDEAGVRKVLCAFLSGYGYTVLEADDGDEATAVAAAHFGPIDLLVTDVVMARVGGAELAKRLAATRPDIRVLFVSGYADREVLDPASLGITSSFLQKPFSSESLAAKVREVLDKPRTSR